MKKGVLENFAKLTGKHLCQNLFFNKVAGIRPATLLKKRPWHRCFPTNFAKFLGTTFFTEHIWMTASIKLQVRRFIDGKQPYSPNNDFDAP